MHGMQTLLDAVVARAQQEPQHQTLLLIDEDGTEQAVSAQAFYRDMLCYARVLQAHGLQPDDLLILVLRHSSELLAAFYGAMYVGVIPSIFPFLTEKLDPDVYMDRVRALVAYADARAVLTFPDFHNPLQDLLSDVDCQVLSTHDMTKKMSSGGTNPALATCSGEKIAFLQHSSGTTGLQKGVALSHRAVLNQLDAYSRAIRLSRHDVIVSWLPLYHDMGLIAGLIMPIASGVPLVLMSPFHWVRDPKRLLWAIHKHAGTLTWLPNFAYNHCVRSIAARDLQGLDLSSLRAVINCSEPVRYDSHQQFLERFAPYGLAAHSLATCYAMAETTFAVTQSPIGQSPHVDWVHLPTLQEKREAIPVDADAPDATPMVSCGIPVAGTEIAVVDESRRTLEPRQVGELRVRGDSMLSEYYHRPDLTVQAIKNGWYYTGDMGYVADGQVYVSGRKKDLIIVGGKNIYPQDLEAIANTVPGIYPGRTVAFGVADSRLGSEAVVMVCELQDASRVNDTIQVERELRRCIVQRADITLADVRLVARRWLLKTSSGKITRAANRDKYMSVFRPRCPGGIMNHPGKKPGR